MFDVVLHQPEIPPNTGNVIRLCANAGATLHLVKPLGFQLTDRALARAGLDYRELAEVALHADWPACAAALAGRRMFAISTRGTVRYDEIRYAAGDILLFGCETRGLPQDLLASLPPAQILRLPMRAPSRSLNLANCVAVVLYEAWRQLGFEGSAGTSAICRGPQME
ncbi:MAG: tRNA (cytidine(34)-2'-O)-methyltransferase [Sterolibacteriaceae bacterium]|nr:tRNA (cytidine(34)-2'-O)-methyltransferase [Candidatus Methylophosphatis haderslevensis]